VGGEVIWVLLHGGRIKTFVQYLFSTILRNSQVRKTISECAISAALKCKQWVGSKRPFTTKLKSVFTFCNSKSNSSDLTFPVLTKANQKCERTQRTNFKSFGLLLEGYQFIFSCLAMLYISKYSFLFIFTFYSVDQIKICQVQIRKYKMALPY